MMKQEEDFALWNQFLEGDEKAYLYIYKLYAQDMYSYGMLFTANSELVKRLPARCICKNITRNPEETLTSR